MQRRLSSELWCRVMTGQGRAAVAVIQLRGVGADVCVAECFQAGGNQPLASGQVRFGTWQRLADRIGESVVVLPVSDEHFEVHCHGGSAAARRIVDDLSALGVADASGDDVFGDELLIAEAVEALGQCQTERTAAIAMDQVRGALRDWADESLSRLESGESAARIAAEARRFAEFGRITTRLNRPWQVVLAGPPNVGKSSLINALLGYDRSITMDHPGTTRDVLDADTVFEGWPFRLRDTAGLREGDSTIEREGIRRAGEAIAAADLILLVSEPGSGSWDEVESQVRGDAVLLRIRNKADLQTSPPPEGMLPTVATTGEGLAELVTAILDRLIGDAPPPGSPAPVNARQQQWLEQIAASAARDELMRLLRDRG